MPPDAHNEPSGETVTVFKYPVWPVGPVKLARRSHPLAKDQTLTSLSQPAETITGELAGEKRTHETQSV